MKHRRFHLSAGDLWEKYTALPENPKRVLRLKSLVFLPTGKTLFLQCLTRGGLRMADGKAWSSRSLNAVLDDLRAANLLTDDLICHPLLLHPVAVDAMASADGEALAEAVRQAFAADSRGFGSYAYDSFGGYDAPARRLRLAIYMNDATAFAANRNRHEKLAVSPDTSGLLASLFQGVDLEVDWLDSRHPTIQAAIFGAKLAAFLQSAHPDPGLPSLIRHFRERQGKEDFAPIGRMLLDYTLLAGQLSEVKRELPTLRGPQDDERQGLEGTLAFLEGRNDAALRHYRQALKLRRKRLGKRKVFLDDMHGLFFLMALLHANDAAVQPEIQAGIDAALSATSRSSYVGGIYALQALLWLVQGLDAKARMLLESLHGSMPAEPLSAACVYLAEQALDADLVLRHRAELVGRFEQLKDQLPLIARIHAGILAEMPNAPAEYELYLTRTGQDLGISFTRIVRIRAPWERALESLDAFLDAGAAKPANSKGPRKAKRLAWFVDPETRYVEAVEQSLKGESWTDGRPVALKRLHERDPRLDYLIEQDHAALRGLRKESGDWYGPDSYAFDPARTIPALAGHPAVFDARQRSRPLELVRYPLEVVVAERHDGYHIALSHNAATAPTVFLEAETPSRYRVIEFPQRMLAVQEILGARGLMVPKAARDQVIALVTRDNPTLPIRTDIAEATQAALEGNPAPVVQIMPFEEGLKLSLLVRPFGPEGPAYVAGIGGRSVLTEIGGQHQRANRDLSRELAERRQLIDACPTLRDRGAADAHEIVLEDQEACLEVLLELQTYAGPLSVEWPEGRRMRVSALSPERLKLRVARNRDWFSVDGTAALDDEQVVEMRFLLERLDRAQGRFVPLEDGSFIALTRQLQTQLGRLAAVSEPHRGGRRVHALGAPALDAVLEEAGAVEADAAWQRHVARIRAAEGWTPQLPRTLQAELRDYQIDGFIWLSRLARWGAGACLADDMGLGKTVQAIAVMLDRADEGPCLVVAPTSVCPNWEAEIGRFAPTLRAHRLAAADRAALVPNLGPRDVLICSYGLLHQEAELLGSRSWQMVVLDEAQAIKNAETRRTQASLALQAEFRLALTGTPVENYLDELWSLFNFLNPGLLGTREGFQKRFAVPIERDHDIHARQALRSLIRPFLLRRTKAAVLSELPPRIEQTLNVGMSEAERAFYEALRQRAMESLAALDVPQGKRKIHILAEISRLRRACCNPALIDPAVGIPSGKLDAFLELVGELISNRHRALVFSQFTSHLKLVRAALEARGIAYEYLDGATPAAERERRVAAFQAGGADLFLISLRAGGTGLNLTAADYVVHLDPWWNPAVEDQASDRAHRIGQERPVTIYRLIMADSIEERILQLHRDKRDLAAELLEGGEATAHLSEEALLDLIRT